jgi:predicted nucleic acid-binding protein
MILADTNVWIDLLKRDPVWLEWSVQQLLLAKKDNALAINAVIFAEMTPMFESLSDQRSFIKASGAQLVPLSDECAHLAGRAYAQYKVKGGNKSGVLADFFIGAQAQAEACALLTRDPGRYKTYFPRVRLICPA